MPKSTNQPVQLQTLMVLGQPARVFVGGAGPQVLLLLHGGWGGAAMHWSRVWDLLGARCRILAPDLPGLGDVTQPGRGNFAGYVAWLEALLDTLAVDKVVCIGNSFGASLAWSLAGRSPQRVAGLVLVDGFAVAQTPSLLLWLGQRRPGRALLRAMVQRVSFRPALLQRAFANPARAPAELHASLTDAPQLEAFVDCLLHGDGAPPPHAPVLVLWGEADRLPGTRVATGCTLATKLQGAQFVAIADAGHFPQLEQPAAFTAAALAFVSDRVAVTRP